MTCPAGTLSELGQEANIFGICFATGQFLLDFLKVITTAIVCVATFTDCGVSRHTAYAATLPEHMAAASRSSRKWLTVYFCYFILLLCKKTIFGYKLKLLRHFHVYNSIIHSVIIIMHRKHMTETLCTV
jgi:hypothetical protein